MPTLKNKTKRVAGRCLAVCLLFLGASRPSLAEEAPIAAPLTANQVVERMVAMNQGRAQALRSYSSIRLYHVENSGLHKRADLLVKMVYHWPDRKEFTILSETGSKALRNRVLKRLIQSEEEALAKENRERTAIHPDNYEFRLVAYERTPQHEFYVLEATPKAKNKFLFRGRIWVDGQDFAVARIEGEPAKNPSWWITKVDFQHGYNKVGDFWLPRRNETVTQVRLFGRSLLTINYATYEIIEAHSVQPIDPGQTLRTASLLKTN